MLRASVFLLCVLGAAGGAWAQAAQPLVAGAPAPAAPQASPYSATVPVAGTSDAQRRAASGAGLELQVDFDPGAIGRLVAQGGGAPSTAGASAANGVPSSTSTGT